MRSIAAPMQNEIKYSIEDKYIFKKTTTTAVNVI